ncbi:MAG: P-loop NTPase [Bacteroidia bacterium]|nr:P-loop NTPase [Bacteroidia bacterium]
MRITEAHLYDALRTVIDPDLRQNIVDAGMVKGLAWNEEDQRVSLTLQLTTPACPLKDYFRSHITTAIQTALSKEWTVQVSFISQTVGGGSESLPQVKNLLLIGSGKGGVGKSTLAVNLAIALARMGARVGLLDADIYGPSIPILLGLEHAKPQVREREGRPLLIPIRKYGVEVMSLGFLVPPGQATPWRGPMASNTLRQLLVETDWGELDYLIVDMPPGTGDIQITLAQQFRPQGAIIITTPQKLACADAEKAITMFRMPLVQVPIVGIVENMAYFWTPELPDRKFYIFGESGGRMLAQKYEVPFLGEIPLLESIVQRSDKGLPPALSDDVFLAAAYDTIAGEVARAVSRLALVSSV